MKCTNCGKETGEEWKTLCVDCYKLDKKTEKPEEKPAPKELKVPEESFVARKSECELTFFSGTPTEIEKNYNDFGNNHKIIASLPENYAGKPLMWIWWK